MKRNLSKETAILLICILFAVFMRVLIILPPATLDGDLAVFGLIAKHIAAGQEFPLFMWFNHYAGTFYSYIVALFFKVGGVSAFNFFAVGAIFSMLWAGLTFLIARRILDPEAARVAFLFVLFPPYPVLYFSMMVMYSEVLLFGSLALFILLKLKDRAWNGTPHAVILGLLCGIGIWINPWLMSIFFTVFIVLLMRKKELKCSIIKFFIVGFILGLSPVIIYNIQNPGITVLRSLSFLLGVDRNMLQSANPATVVLQRVAQRIAIIPMNGLSAVIVSIQLSGLFNVAVFICGIIPALQSFKARWNRRKIEPFDWLIIYAFCFLLFYMLFSIELVPRYIYPLYLIFPFVIAKYITKRRRGIVLTVLIITFNLTSVGHALSTRTLHHYPELTKWLQYHGLERGFSDYGTAYNIILESGEKVIISPTLFHPTFKERRPAYTELVRSAEDVFYVVDARLKPEIAREIELKLNNFGVAYQLNVVKEFVVFSHLSEPIFPEQLELKLIRPKVQVKLSFFPQI